MEKQRAGFVKEAEEMFEEVMKWREENQQASIDEIVEKVSVERRKIMGGLVEKVALAHGNGAEALGVKCKECGEEMENKGENQRSVMHEEGESKLKRAYYYCSKCKTGVFPLDEVLAVGDHSWSPGTIRWALRMGIEIASYERAAMTFSELMHLSLSKSSLQRMVKKYGGELVKQQEAEAEAMVKAPSKAEVEVVYRKRVQPESETMSVSHDGNLIHIRGEGWKEVKIVAVSAVTTTTDEQSGEQQVQLSQHSYRAGLWDAATFANQQWVEAEKRGLFFAKRLACVADGAAWIWQIVFMCFAPCFQILDWWHATQYLWMIANAAFSNPKEATAWVEQQKSLLLNSHLTQFFANVRLLFPRTSPLPDPVRTAVLYLFHHRHRLDYASFRRLGLPIGSGSVESAGKVVVQARLKQAGMRWSRSGAQAMLALRAALLSNRWPATCHSLSLA